MHRIALVVAGVALMTACASSAPPPSPAARAALAPTGKLRAGINYGNFILAQKDPATGDSRGPAIDLTRELGKRLGVPVELVAYTAVGTMVDGAKAGAWDIAFLGSDPARAGEIDFTAAYLELEATYLVPANSRLRTIADVDQEGVRVTAPARANYELYLSRNLKRANLVRADNAEAAFKLLAEGRVEALAGLSQALVSLSEKLPGSRMIDGRFMAVPQSVGTPKGRDAGFVYLRAFVEEAKASGMVARSIQNTEDRLQPRGGAVPVEALRDELAPAGGNLRAQRIVRHHALEAPREPAHITVRRHERGDAVLRVVTAAPIVEGDEGGAAGHGLHRGHAEPLVPGRAEIDGAAAVEPGESFLGQVLMEFVVGKLLARRPHPKAHELHLRMLRPHRGHRLDAFPHALPCVVVMQHQHA